MITNICGSKIIKDIVDKLLTTDKIKEKSKIDIVELAAEYEYNLILGRREIIHLEAFITGIMKALFTEKKN